MEEITNVSDALNEYYKLKRNFENDLNGHKQKINAKNLSKREKRDEYLKLKPKCINCKRPSKIGTLFTIERIPETNDGPTFRKLKCSCGDLANPCILDIEIHLGDEEAIDELMNKIQDEIRVNKNKIIIDKNKLLFGLITTETALNNFEFNKTYITELTTLYGHYLDLWNKMIDSPEKKIELEEALVQSYTNILEIKEAMKKMMETDNTTYAHEAVRIYVNILNPLLERIRQLKYSESSVYRDENNNCRLMQTKYTYEYMSVSSFESKVVHFTMGSAKDKKSATQGATQGATRRSNSSS